ncbi:hypothetical protein EHEL_090720 [Encephalitozoon hellem ATCC 50504]|uniref:Uncharacterized protein n=1 Tax=Encephalitozoon hellem TaxID=27973 RepID=A0A9Q9C4G3_ENCHE|nr:uncharacterized protein EHEL_090720 [Encephalitozoon hellem ATCC 50504]AFM98967.1 hypothetical protein EHEL_090720 [Encephalitozoon hellem ATCC 50504]UTX43981.1 hypothetical protein GPU96_09g17610 [Encephalitozoon hellem]WEL39466.1 hypothetical protein PFJ87_09g00940 [Encephalitozoon hellem]|eukprot:XP_003887948.1 hypothetical protein EHEL_090720 [Encephalitozoon hellem ATCC 50504]
MMPFDREERALIEKEYERHMRDIRKAEMRERHFEMKDRGYTLSLSALGSSMNVVSVFLGYIEGLGIDKRNVYGHIADAILDGNSGIAENLTSILRQGLRDEASISMEIVKIHGQTC